MKTAILATLLTSLAAPLALAGENVVIHKNEGCTCCDEYGKYLRDNGYEATVIADAELPAYKRAHKVPEALESCHTFILEGYTIEGHVPVSAINKLLAEKQAIDGLALAGMPSNSPGMGAPNGEPLEVMSFKDGKSELFLRE